MDVDLWQRSDEVDFGGRLAPRFARVVIGVVFTGFCALSLIAIATRQLPTEQVLLAGLLILALLTVQFEQVRRYTRQLQTPVNYILFGVQALLSYVPFLLYRDDWLGLPGFVAGTALLIFPGVIGWIAFGGLVAFQGVLQYWYGPPPLLEYLSFSVGSTLITGLMVYGFSYLSYLVSAMHKARTEMARLAVAAERLRFSRDLHDLLGYSLSAISLKSELTHRLVTKNPARAEEELAQILEISRQALADVRSVASGYRELSLDEEAVSARSVLVAADVEVQMDLEHHDLPARVRTVLATVLREGVTNILRHSKAEHCEIKLRQTSTEVTIEICNDGVNEPHVDDHTSGSGIHNLSNRVTDLGGRLTATPADDNRFRLSAYIPTSRPDFELTSRKSKEDAVHSS